MGELDLQRVEEALATALELPVEERGARLERICENDSSLRREVEALLALAPEAASYFESLRGAIGEAASLEIESAARPRLQIGPYRALAALGHGGMGAVYLAERADGAFEQRVALKLLHRDMETPELQARFLAERQLLARLSHANIAHLLDGGVTDEGRPYFVMEHVEGLPITRYCEREALSQRQVLRLFAQVIEAVSYLHRNLVVHRDLKPSNVLVDRDGAVKLLDFGIAKLLDEESRASGLTRTSERLLTPEYAAPEQMRGEQVTTATDVYALGAMLYELLTGARPGGEHGSGRDGTTLPPAPSAKLRALSRAAPSSVPQGSGTAARRATRAWSRIDPDLDAICLAALRPEPEARYASADQLGQDLERFLEGSPIRARKGTLGYRTAKFVERHRRGVALAALGVAALLGGFLRERGLRQEADRARAEAQLQAGRAVAVSDFLATLLASVNPLEAQGREVSVADVLEQAATKISSSPELSGQPEVEATLRQTIGATYTALGKYAEAREHLERAVALRGGLAARTPESLAAAADLGVLYSRLGLSEAEEILRDVLEGRTAALGEEDPLVLVSLTQLADLYWEQGRYDEVEALDRRSLAIRRRVLGEEHPETLKSLNGLAATLFVRGRYEEAAASFERAREVAGRLLGEHHPHTLTLGSNVAAAYLELGRYAEAEPLLREVIADRRRVLGNAHAETAISIHNLGVVLAMQARLGEAEQVLREAAEIRSQLPAGGRATSTSRSHLADVLRDQGRLAEAEALYREVLAAQNEIFGHDDSETLRTRAAFAELRRRQGDLTSAEHQLLEILDAVAKVRPPEHPDHVGALTALAQVRNQQGRHAEALELARRASTAGTRGLGVEHPVVLAARMEEARALEGQRDLPAAAALYAQVLSSRTLRLGDEHPRTLEAARALAAVRSAGAPG